MGSTVAAIPAAGASSILQASFDDLEKQRELITSCTRLWKELSEQFESLDKDLQLKSECLRSKLLALDRSTQQALDSLHRREQSIDGSVDLALARVDARREAAIRAASEPDPDDGCGLAERLRALCTKMDAEGFWDLVASRRKEVEAIRTELPLLLSDCVDPPRFSMDAMSGVFPVDRKGGKGASDYGWACVVILEALVSVLADPELGAARPLITPAVRERAEDIARTWKEGLEQRGGVESAKPPDVHTFLQHVVTFGIASENDRDFYRKLVVSSSWRKQMPKLAISLGLGDCMNDIIDELINKGQQLDAVNFAYEAGLVDNYPPVPLLKSYLEDSKKAATTILDERNNSGRALHLAGRKEQSALRAVLKCIEEHELESEFPPDELLKRLEQLEKPKSERKKPVVVSVPANKRTRANCGGPLPPAKAGRLTNHAHVSSFPSPPTFIRSPTSHAPYTSGIPHFAYDRSGVPSPYGSQSPVGVHGSFGSQSPAGIPSSYGSQSPVGIPSSYGSQSPLGVPSPFGSQSPTAIRDHYTYRQDEMAPPHLGMPYTCSPVNYPVYAGYNNGLAPAYQHVYYR